MDFSKFKTVEENKADIKRIRKTKTSARYQLMIGKDIVGNYILTVKDTFERSTPFQITATPKKLDFWKSKCKKDYRPLVILENELQPNN